jgi:hypothetical protein
MALIATSIEPQGTARIFFDLRPAVPGADDEARIEETIERAFALATGSGENGKLRRAA